MEVWRSGGRGLRLGAGTGLRKGVEIAPGRSRDSDRVPEWVSLALQFSPLHRGIAYCIQMVERRDGGVIIVSHDVT